MSRRSVEKEGYWRDMVARFEQSGLKVGAFCDQAGIKADRFYTWRRKLRERDEEMAAIAPDRSAAGSRIAAFASVHVVGASWASHCCIEIIVGNGKRVAVAPGFDRATLLQVLAVVEGRVC